MGNATRALVWLGTGTRYYDTDGTNGVTPQDPGTQALVYMATAPSFGEVYVNCAHKDTKATDWTTY